MLTDSSTGVQFLADSGAAVSLFPHFSPAAASGPSLTAANGQPIKCWGHRRLAPVFGGQHFAWDFLLAAVAYPIIGADFLKHYGLAVDPASGGLISSYAAVTANHRPAGLPKVICGVEAPEAVPAANRPSGGTAGSWPGPGSSLVAVAAEAALSAVPAANRPAGGTAGPSPGPGPGLLHPSSSAADSSAVPAASRPPGSTAPPALSADLPPKVVELLLKFPDVLLEAPDLPPASHSTRHHIITDGPPVTARFRRLDPSKLAAAKKIFSDWERAGIVRRSSSCWSSPLHMVQKKDGSWRPVGDFRRLNVVTAADKYPVPNMADFSSNLAGKTVFSTLDLRSGYLQVPLAEDAIPKTAVITPFGLFEFLRMPFGLKNAGMSFQRMMDQLFHGLDFVFVYIDDILVASPDMETHIRDLEVVFNKLRTHGLVLNLDKCVFARRQVDFLGHVISADGSAPLPSKVEAVNKHPQPATVKDMQQFLGMLNFYRKFIPAAAKILRPLTDALKGGQSGSTRLQWSAEMKAAFSAAKSSLVAATVLAHPVVGARLSLAVDASNTHVGAVLQQQRAADGGWEPLGFFSRKLNAAESKYSAFDRELVAAFSGIRHFRFALEGRLFELWSDHKPLLYAVQSPAEKYTARQQRQMSYIAEYTNIFRHVPGKENVVADWLSRPPGAVSAVAEADGTAGACSTPSSSPGIIDFAAIAAAQRGCADLAKLQGHTDLHVRLVDVEGHRLLCDDSTGVLRPLVPLVHRRLLFAAIHNIAHPGVRATRRLLAARFVWPGLAKDVASWCRDCQDCQRGKVVKQYTAAIEPIAVPSRRFAVVHIDLVGPLPCAADGSTHILTMMDRSTRWPEAVTLSSTTATACADAFIACWVARYGVPDAIISDRGVQFCSEVWSVLMKKLGVQHRLTTAYHPQANGMIERFHRQLKDALRSRSASIDWAKHLPWVMLGLRAAPKEDSGLSAAELMFGAPLALPGQLLGGGETELETVSSWLRSHSTSLPTRSLAASGSSEVDFDRLCEADFVYVRRGGVGPPLSPAYSGPYRVLQRQAKFFILDVGGREDSVSVDRLKPHLGQAPLQPALPPRRGRPPVQR